jgi:hypothetical protein
MVASGYFPSPYTPPSIPYGTTKTSYTPIYSQTSISVPVPESKHLPSTSSVSIYSREFKPFDLTTLLGVPTIAPKSFSYSAPPKAPQVDIKPVNIPIPEPQAPVTTTPIHVPIPSYSVYAPVPTTPHYATPDRPTISYPPPVHYSNIKEGQKARIWGDPHGVVPNKNGGNTEFNFYEVGVHSALNDKSGPGLALNQTYAKDNWGDATVTKASELVLGADKVTVGLAHEGFDVKVNGKAMQGDTLTFNGHKIIKQGNELIVDPSNTFEYDFKYIKQGTGAGAGAYIDTDITATRDGDHIDPTGWLADPWANGGTLVNKPVGSYLVK